MFKLKILLLLLDRYNIMTKSTIFLWIIWHPCFTLLASWGPIHKLQFDNIYDMLCDGSSFSKLTS